MVIKKRGPKGWEGGREHIFLIKKIFCDPNDVIRSALCSPDRVEHFTNLIHVHIGSRKFFPVVRRQVTAQKWQICWEFPGRFFAKKVTKFHVFQCVIRSGHHTDLIRSALCYPDLQEYFINS